MWVSGLARSGIFSHAGAAKGRHSAEGLRQCGQRLNPADEASHDRIIARDYRTHVDAGGMPWILPLRCQVGHLPSAWSARTMVACAMPTGRERAAGSYAVDCFVT